MASRCFLACAFGLPPGPCERRRHPSFRRRGGGRSSGEGTGRRRARRGEDGDARRAPSTCDAVCLREANWYATRCVGASEAIQIAANRGECGCQCADPSRGVARIECGAAVRDFPSVNPGCQSMLQHGHEPWSPVGGLAERSERTVDVAFFHRWRLPGVRTLARNWRMPP